MTQSNLVNYDAIAATYHGRYQVGHLEGVSRSLLALAKRIKARHILETGCGTGRWLGEFQALGAAVVGLDRSAGMLKQAQEAGFSHLVQGQAEALPFSSGSFDLVFCVNAFHHFTDPRKFIQSACRLLKPGGALAVIGMDPHRRVDRWGVYDYFPGTLELDMERFVSSGTILDWMVESGFQKVEWQVAHHIQDNLSGDEILKSHFLGKNGTSQLVLITDEAYQQGIARIELAVDAAAREGTELFFPSEIDLVMTVGRL